MLGCGVQRGAGGCPLSSPWGCGRLILSGSLPPCSYLRGSEFPHCLLCPRLAPHEQSWPPPLQMECLLSAAMNVTRSPQLTSPPILFIYLFIYCLKIPHPPSFLPVLCRAWLLSLAAAGCGSCIASSITSPVLLQTPGSRVEFLRAGCYACSCSVFWGSSSRIPCMCPPTRVCI